MIYARPLRTRATDCGPDRWVTLPHVISYFEHLRWEWLRVPELGLVDAIHQGHGFYVIEQQVALSRRFGQGEDAMVRGVLRTVGRARASADQDLVRNDGILLAHCHIMGVWVRPNGRLGKIPRQAMDGIGTQPLPSQRGEAEARDANSLFDPPQPLRHGGLDLPIHDDIPPDAHRRLMSVRATDCDVFQHVNAAGYVRYLADSLFVQGASPSLHRASVRYSGQALAGDTVEVRSWNVEGDVWAGAVLRGDEVLFRGTVETEA